MSGEPRGFALLRAAKATDDPIICGEVEMWVEVPDDSAPYRDAYDWERLDSAKMADGPRDPEAFMFEPKRPRRP